mmetsp:Transcript_72311/g.192234  ORF Transcript_72311/g.192234 Transcript_72311/m.192234 type:complete len:276 (-) Transcript_72311:658-1485(-)|eukprot:5968229-Prymnesium_polylepis.2
MTCSSSARRAAAVPAAAGLQGGHTTQRSRRACAHDVCRRNASSVASLVGDPQHSCAPPHTRSPRRTGVALGRGGRPAHHARPAASSRALGAGGRAREAVEAVRARLELAKEQLELLVGAILQHVGQVAARHRRHLAVEAARAQPLEELGLALPVGLGADVQEAAAGRDEGLDDAQQRRYRLARVHQVGADEHVVRRRPRRRVAPVEHGGLGARRGERVERQVVREVLHRARRQVGEQHARRAAQPGGDDAAQPAPRAQLADGAIHQLFAQLDEPV